MSLSAFHFKCTETVFLFHLPFTYYAGHLATSTELQSYIISNEYKWSPVFNFTEVVRFSHASHGSVERFTGTFTFHQMSIKVFHELQRSFVINGPQCDNNRTSTGACKCSRDTNHTFSLDLSTTTMTALSTTSLACSFASSTSFIVNK